MSYVRKGVWMKIYHSSFIIKKKVDYIEVDMKGMGDETFIIQHS